MSEYVYARNHYIDNKDFYKEVCLWQDYKLRIDLANYLREHIEEEKTNIQNILEKYYNDSKIKKNISVDDLFSKCGEIIPDIEKILTKYYDKNKNVLHDNMTVSKKRIVDDRIFELYYDDSNRNNIEKSLKKLQEIKLTPRENTIYKKLYDSIGLKILLIIDRTAKFPNFSGYPFLEDMKMLAMEHCIKYMKTFDRNISNNPFVFFSRTAFNAFVQELNKEKKIFNEKFEYVKKHVDEKLLKYDYKNFTIELPTTDEEIDEFYKDCESENE